MKIIKFNDIQALPISPSQYYHWVEEALSMKSECILPEKISLHPFPQNLYNTMPCIIPAIDIMGIKVVLRYPGHAPALYSHTLLYRQSTGELLTVMDSTAITAWRTGAVAAHSLRLFARPDTKTIGLIGLGNTTRASIRILLDIERERHFHFQLFRYKEQAEEFIRDFSQYPNADFSILDTCEDVIRLSDATISGVTFMDKLFASDEHFLAGCTIVPIHTRGFQNCDLFFDKIYADDTDHVKNFRYFNHFKQFYEVADVLSGNAPGRQNDQERIIAYNVGIALHDVYIAYKLYNMADDIPEMPFDESNRKYII